MPRTRNIKHSFFTNDKLAEIEPLGRLFYIGLWTLADYNGNLEWRPKKLKVQLLPYDNADIAQIAINLDKYGFIRFYSNVDNAQNFNAQNDKIFAHIVNFGKHQNPHKNERDKNSEIPLFENCASLAPTIKGFEIYREESRENPEDSTSNRARSLILDPDHLILDPDNCASAQMDEKAKPKKTNAQKVTNEELENYFDQFWEAYPNKKDKARAKKAFFKLKVDCELLKEMLNAIQKQIHWRNVTNGFTPEWKHPTTWLNGENWEDETYILKRDDKSQVLSSKDRASFEALQQWSAGNGQ